jgi:hypothetical protein
MGFRIQSDERRTIVRDVPRGSTTFGLVFVCSSLVAELGLAETTPLRSIRT